MATADPGANVAGRTPLSEPLLTADEVAALLRVPRSTIYELTRTRRLPHIKVGRRTLFVRVDLDAWVAANRVASR
jgi:excisionase family DNA binding protein